MLSINNFFSYIYLNVFLFSILGYFLENKFKIIQKISYYLGKKNFFRKINYEYRIFLPLFILEIPIIVFLIFLKDYLKTNLLICFVGTFIGQFLKLYSIHRNIIEMDFPNKRDESFIRILDNNLLSEEISLNMGQIYSKILLPYLFFILPFITPLFVKEIFYIIPSYDIDKITIISIVSFLTILLRYLIISDNFYFDKINIYNFTFTLIKYTFCVIVVFLTIFLKSNIYLTIIMIILSSFIIPWHPYKFR
ncbi:MAG: hypothetical protein KatS3mg068_1331 [Candidatus Sericytochromatia bacterium]|nr:MAG: hypothetical protein KatS3mg068_1331 [Candidatus Sericytochromatia bacterium]